MCIGRLLNRAFSLIELLVVITIIALLAAIAVPFYKDYVIKVTIAKYTPIAQKLILDAKDHYERTGSFPDSIEFNDETIIPATWTEINFSNIRSMIYIISTDGLGMRIHLNLSGLEGIPGYTSPAVTPSNSRSVIVFAVKDFDGTLVTVCGQSSAAFATNMIPVAYLPPVCSCTEINTFIDSATPIC